jgi:hypothetical protein
MTLAVTTIITVGLTMSFLVAPNIPVPIPHVTMSNLNFQIPYGKFGDFSITKAPNSSINDGGNTFQPS